MNEETQTDGKEQAHTTDEPTERVADASTVSAEVLSDESDESADLQTEQDDAVSDAAELTSEESAAGEESEAESDNQVDASVEDNDIESITSESDAGSKESSNPGDEDEADEDSDLDDAELASSEESEETFLIDESMESDEEVTATSAELKPVIEALLFVAEEPLVLKQLCKVLGGVDEGEVRGALGELQTEYEERGSGLEIREIANGWRISTRPQYHDFIRAYLKTRPSARLSLPALETLAVIAYKQPITIPEILEIRGVTSSSSIKTLLEKRLIVTKGRKETVGRPMMYGTSKEFLMHFGLRDLGELPSIEDFEDLSQG